MKVICFLLLAFFVSCSSDDSRATKAKKKTDPVQTDGWTDGGSDGGTTVDPYCTGTITDGAPDQSYPQSPLFLYQFSLANGATWTPGTYPTSDNYVSGVDYKNLALGEAFSFFKNDGAIFIRVKLDPMRSFAHNTTKGCWNRQTPGAAPIVGYSKLKFRVSAFTITSGASGYTKTGTNRFVGDYEVDLNGCSPIIKIPNLSGSTANVSTAFEITSLQTDTNCLVVEESNYSETYKEKLRKTYCPVSTTPKTVCVDGVIQVSTNETHFFRGKSRSNY